MKRPTLLALLVGASLFTHGAVSAQVFTGSGTGSIADGLADLDANGPPDWSPALNVTFTVPELSGAIADMALSITLNHSFAGDLEAVLIPPANSGADPFVIFSRLGQQVNFPFPPTSTSGSPSRFGANLGTTPVTFTFSDSASAGNLWTAAGFDTGNGTQIDEPFDIALGGYRTSVAGPWDVAGNPNGGNHNAGQLTSFATDSGFIGLSPAQAMGTWTLQIRDGALRDVGSVSAADLTIVPVPEPLHYALLTGLGLIAFAGYRRYSRVKV